MTDNHIGEMAERALADKLLDECHNRYWEAYHAAHKRSGRTFGGHAAGIAAVIECARTATPVSEGGKKYREPTLQEVSKVIRWVRARNLHMDDAPTLADALASIGAVVPAHPSPDVRAVKEE